MDQFNFICHLVHHQCLCWRPAWKLVYVITTFLDTLVDRQAVVAFLTSSLLLTKLVTDKLPSSTSHRRRRCARDRQTSAQVQCPSSVRSWSRRATRHRRHLVIGDVTATETLAVSVRPNQFLSSLLCV